MVELQDPAVPSRPYVDKEGSHVNVWPARWPNCYYQTGPAYLSTMYFTLLTSGPVSSSYLLTWILYVYPVPSAPVSSLTPLYTIGT
jgi:hypothetical protein